MTRTAALDPFRGLLAAVMFLTRIPVPSALGHREDDLARSTVFFPLIGALVGAVGGGVFLLAERLWTVPIAVVLATAATVRLTGAFHEDALADACDGLGGGWSREQVLTVMKDSRIGSYGAIGLILVVGLKLAALAALPAPSVVGALVAGHVLGRWSALPLIFAHPYVRETEGTGKPFAAGVTAARLIGGSALAVAFVVAAVGRDALGAFAAAALVTLLAGRYFRRRIGGITGDCLGAANQLVEVSVYLVLALR